MVVSRRRRQLCTRRRFPQVGHCWGSPRSPGSSCRVLSVTTAPSKVGSAARTRSRTACSWSASVLSRWVCAQLTRSLPSASRAATIVGGRVFMGSFLLGRRPRSRPASPLLPNRSFYPTAPAGARPRTETSHTHMFVPMDDENCMVYNLYYRFGGSAFTREERERNEWHRGRGPGEIGADFRKARNRTNDWGLNRTVQRTETFSGIDGINSQDHAVQESMGPIVDRSREHLGSSDKAVIAARRLLLEATRQVAEG